MKKIIIIGDTCGNFDYVFDRIATIHTKHGPFDAAFCVGNFFGDDSSSLTPYIKEEKTIAIPTYFIVSNDADTSLIDKVPNGGIICNNLTFLGRFGVQTINGISVAYLSGLYDSNLFNKAPETPSKHFLKHYCSKDINHNLEHKNVDILLTSEWSRNFHLGIVHKIDTFSVLPKHLSLSQFAELGRSPIVNKLAMQFCPQYHFSASEDVFFRLTPYKSDEKTTHLTRFIALGSVQSTSEQRSVYAANITPLSSSAAAPLASSIKYTKCPYALAFKHVTEQKDNNNTEELKRVLHKRKFSEMTQTNHRWTNDNPAPNYVCYKCGIPGHYINECEGKTDGHTGGNRDDYFFEKFGGRRAMKRAKKSGGECWFCLGSSKVESHMLVSIAEFTYIAIAKGPLTKNHLLIIPINHISNSMKFSVGVRKEIDRYLLCLEKCYAKDNKVLLICDRNLPTQYTQHCYLEIVAIDKDKVEGLEEVLFKEAEKVNIKFIVNDSKDNKSSIGNVSSFGYLILHNNGNGKKYIHSVQSGMKKKISLNFLRKVIAIHLDQPEKAEWTACIQQNADEINQTNRLKDKFKPFDWTHSHLLNAQNN